MLEPRKSRCGQELTQENQGESLTHWNFRPRARPVWTHKRVAHETLANSSWVLSFIQQALNELAERLLCGSVKYGDVGAVQAKGARSLVRRRVRV